MKKKPSLEQRKEIYCVMHGHSKIVSACFGYISCERCGSQIGDALGSVFDTTEHVIVGHNCAKCRENFKKLKKGDKVHISKAVLKELEAMTVNT